MFLPVYEFMPLIYFLARIEFARGMLANKEDWNKLVMAAKMVSDPNIQVRLNHKRPIANSGNIHWILSRPKYPGKARSYKPKSNSKN